MDVPTWFRQKWCKHNSVKHWSRKHNGYVGRCVKCGKMIPRNRKVAPVQPEKRPYEL